MIGSPTAIEIGTFGRHIVLGMPLGPDALRAPHDVRHDRHVGGDGHARRPRLELLDLEASADRGLRVDADQLAFLERLAGLLERGGAAVTVHLDVPQAAHDRSGELAVEDLFLRHEPNLAAQVLLVGGQSGEREVEVAGVVDRDDGTARAGQVLHAGNGELQPLHPPHQAGELDDCPVYRFHIRQPSRVTVPSEPVPVPEIVDCIAGGRPVVAVWVNELGGVTFQVGSGAAREFVKVSPPAEWAHPLADSSPSAIGCAGRARYVRVPRVLGAGDGWLHTAGLPGRSAVDPHWVADPRTAARAIGAGLRLLHDRLPVDDCPFGPPPWVTDSLPIDRLVVCHGDACAPNTLIDDDGRLAAGTSTSETSASPIGGPTWRWPRCRCRGTTPARGTASCLTPTAWIRTRLASSTTGGCGTPAISPPIKLNRSSASTRKGVSAGHKRRACGFPDRHQGRKHPVRPVGQPGVLRVVVPVPGQQHAGLGRPWRRRLPLRLAPAPRPLRPEEPARARQQGRGRAAARLPGARPATRTREGGLSLGSSRRRTRSSTASAGPRATSM